MQHSKPMQLSVTWGVGVGGGKSDVNHGVIYFNLKIQRCKRLLKS